MELSVSNKQRIRYLLRPIASLACATLMMLNVSADQDSSVIVRIEEDWKMDIVEPAPENDSPQVTFFVNPGATNLNAYFQIQMNYATDAAFSGGGFHVSAVSNDSYVDQARSGTRLGLSVDQDTIRWTNVMAIDNNALLFAIKNGYCRDWGNFGGPEYLVRMPAAGHTTLNDYRPQHSLDEVDIGFGGNRVSSVELKDVRIYYSDGRIESIPLHLFVER